MPRKEESPGAATPRDPSTDLVGVDSSSTNSLRSLSKMEASLLNARLQMEDVNLRSGQLFEESVNALSEAGSKLHVIRDDVQQSQRHLWRRILTMSERILNTLTHSLK